MENEFIFSTFGGFPIVPSETLTTRKEIMSMYLNTFSEVLVERLEACRFPAEIEIAIPQSIAEKVSLNKIELNLGKMLGYNHEGYENAFFHVYASDVPEFKVESAIVPGDRELSEDLLEELNSVLHTVLENALSVHRPR